MTQEKKDSSDNAVITKLVLIEMLLREPEEIVFAVNPGPGVVVESAMNRTKLIKMVRHNPVRIFLANGNAASMGFCIVVQNPEVHGKTRNIWLKLRGAENAVLQ